MHVFSYHIYSTTRSSNQHIAQLPHLIQNTQLILILLGFFVNACIFTNWFILSHWHPTYSQKSLGLFTRTNHVIHATLSLQNSDTHQISFKTSIRIYRPQFKQISSTTLWGFNDSSIDRPYQQHSLKRKRFFCITKNR